MKIYNILRIVIIVFIGTSNLFAQWSIDSRINNPISTADGDQVNQAIASDGEGGVIITWHDGRNGTDNDIYAQRVRT